MRRVSAMALDAERLQAPPAHIDQVEDESGEEHGGEEARQDADEERDRESLDGPGPELVEDDGRHEDRHVRVDDSRERSLEARVDRRAHRLAQAKLLPDSLE